MSYETIPINNLLELISKFTVAVRSEPTVVWRGQTCSDWGLTPSLFRSNPNPQNFEWDSREDALLRYFEKSNRRWLQEHHAQGFIERLTQSSRFGPVQLVTLSPAEWNELINRVQRRGLRPV